MYIYPLNYEYLDSINKFLTILIDRLIEWIKAG